MTKRAEELAVEYQLKIIKESTRYPSEREWDAINGYKGFHAGYAAAEKDALNSEVVRELEKTLQVEHQRYLDSIDTAQLLREQTNKSFRDQIAALKAENEKFRKALEFYANPVLFFHNGELVEHGIRVECGVFHYTDPPKEIPGVKLGARAREALAQEDIFERIENANKEELHHVKQGKEE